MKRKRSSQQCSVKVKIEHVYTHDSDWRIAKAYQIVLQAAARLEERESTIAKSDEQPNEEAEEVTP